MELSQRPAILAPGRTPLDSQSLNRQISQTVEALRVFGCTSSTRLGLSLGDSPELATLTVAVMSYATAVPISQGLSAIELLEYLRACGVDAVVVQKGTPSPAREAAMTLNLPIFEVLADPADPAGVFRLESTGNPSAGIAHCGPGTDDVALVLSTSGTTGTPKIVPLSHSNLLTAMTANCRVLELSDRDRCLSVMPLSHIHGLGAVLCSLLSGGSVVVTPGPSVASFYDWLLEFHPTWYTAVPTIHQAILEQAAQRVDAVATILQRRQLRMIRSGSAPMPAGVPEQLERLFGATYVEASGATEASAYIFSNRPRSRRIGSVGMPMPETNAQIIDEQGQPLPPDVQGEIVARGPGIFAGYENDPEATAAAFINGYFRTGDLGHRDADGFFFITGRVKEQINRAGMKISPMEVDRALLEHPAVAQAAAFAIPDSRVGEEVAAVVVLHPGHQAGELELQRHVASRLAEHKVPRRVVFVGEIPRGRTGKIRRVALAGQLGLATAGDAQPVYDPKRATEPRTPVEQVLASLWSQAIGRHVGDIDARFTILGGDSLQAAALCALVWQRFGQRLPLATLFTHPTIRRMSKLLESQGWQPAPGAPVVLREGDPTRPVLFVLPGIGGNIYSYHALAQHLPAWQRVVGIPLPGADGLEPPLVTVEAVAERFANVMIREQPIGPYLVCGYSFGGRTAFEVARQLRDAGREMKLVALFDTPAPGWPPCRAVRARIATHFRRARHIGILKAAYRALFSGRKNHQVVREDVAQATRLADGALPGQQKQNQFSAHYRAAAGRWIPRPIDTPICLFRSRVTIWDHADVSDPAMGWGRFAPRGVTTVMIPGSHMTMFHEPNVTELAHRVTQILPPPAEASLLPVSAVALSADLQRPAAAAR